MVIDQRTKICIKIVGIERMDFMRLSFDLLLGKLKECTCKGLRFGYFFQTHSYFIARCTASAGGITDVVTRHVSFA